MAKVFLDANKVIDLLERKKEPDPGSLRVHTLFISPLSIHIFAYLYKHGCPSLLLQETTRAFSMVNLDGALINLASLGPTVDFEDNIQLHSANQAECDFFLTADKALLKLGVFGKTKIVGHL